MFKNILVFNIDPAWTTTHEALEAALEGARFMECGASQERSAGWIEPRGEQHGQLVESIGEQWIAKMMVETKILPPSVVKEAVAKRCEEIKKTTGRKPGRKEKKDLTEDVRNDLMAKAFTKKSAAVVWIDRSAQRLIVEANSLAKADDIVSLLVTSLDGFKVSLVTTNQSPAAAMSFWLDAQETPEGFSSDRDCVLKACDDSKSSVRYAKHALDIEEIRAHIAAGKMPVQLAMTWNHRVSFVLTDTGALKKIEILDVVTESHSAKGDDSAFDADVAIAMGELRQLIPALLEALGGEEMSASTGSVAA